MARIYLRKGRGWYLDVRWKDRRYRERIGPDDMLKKDARAAALKREHEIQQEEIYGTPAEPVLFAAFADDFLATDSPGKRSKDRDTGIVAALKARWKGLTLDAITPKMIEDFKAERLADRAPATVNKELQTIKRMFRKAVEWKRLGESPATTVHKERVHNTRVRFLEPDEMARLMQAAPEWLRSLIIFARFTGARRGEMLSLTWNDVDLKRGLLTFRDTKNGTDGTVRLNNTVRALLEGLPAPIDRSQGVFPLPNVTASWMAIRRAWRDACSTAKISGFRWHDLRHQAATDLIARGRTLYDVQGFLRHKTTSMTTRYAHLTDARQEETALALDAVGTGLEKGTREGTDKGQTA